MNSITWRGWKIPQANFVRESLNDPRSFDLITNHIRDVLRSNCVFPSFKSANSQDSYLIDLLKYVISWNFMQLAWRRVEKGMLSVREPRYRQIRNGIWAHVFRHVSELFSTGKKETLVNMFSRLAHPRAQTTSKEKVWRNQLEYASESEINSKIFTRFVGSFECRKFRVNLLVVQPIYFHLRISIAIGDEAFYGLINLNWPIEFLAPRLETWILKTTCLNVIGGNLRSM